MNKAWGGLGVVSTLFWLVGIVVEFATTKGTSLYQAGDVLIWIGFVGIAAFIVGLLRGGVAGRGVFAKIALGVWAFGHLSIAIGGVVELFTDNADNPFYPLGGLSQILGGIAASIVIARAGVLTGWRRWTPLAWLIAYLGVFVTLFDSSENPPAVMLVPFVVWLATIAATSIAATTAPATAS
jgi:hypothetical protein